MRASMGNERMAKEYIDRVAIEFSDVTLDLPRPARHHDVIELHVKLTGQRGSGRQGFVTSAGRFVDRHTAAALAFEAGQIPRRAGALYSEDLW